MIEMTCEEKMALRAEDFMKPNPVLCYGGGRIVHWYCTLSSALRD